jgi:hypothetical protein
MNVVNSFLIIFLGPWNWGMIASIFVLRTSQTLARVLFSLLASATMQSTLFLLPWDGVGIEVYVLNDGFFYGLCKIILFCTIVTSPYCLLVQIAAKRKLIPVGHIRPFLIGLVASNVYIFIVYFLLVSIAVTFISILK